MVSSRKWLKKPTSSVSSGLARFRLKDLRVAWNGRTDRKACTGNMAASCRDAPVAQDAFMCFETRHPVRSVPRFVEPGERD
jgi:hypothetical protein